MLKINFTKTQPTKVGWYMAKWGLTGRVTIHQVLWIEEHEAYGVRWEGQLRATGGSTHFSRWDCLWSDELDVGVAS